MKHLKMVGLAALAVTALMAFGAVSSAMGAEASLCKIKSSGACTGTNLYASGTVLKGATAAGEAGRAKLTTNKLGTVFCNSSVEGHSTEATSTAVTGLAGEVTGLTFTGCKLEESVACSVTVVSLPYESHITTNGVEGNGTLVVHEKGGAGKPGAAVKCPEATGNTINCTYRITGTNAELAATGGVAGVAKAEAEKVALTGTGEASKCPASTWDGTYFLTEPSPVFVGM